MFDTRTGLGNGGTVAPVAANSSKTIQVTGAAGIPSSGVSSVVVTATTFDAANAGFISLGADASTGFVAVVFDANTVDSNTAVVDVSPTGTIALGSNQSVNVAIEVQGYFATGNGTPAPGGYVSVGASALTSQANVASGSTIEVQASGNIGIPSTATAIFANITVVAPAGNDGWLTAWPTQAPQPATKVAFTAGQTTALGMTIDLNASGRFSLINGGVSGPVTYYIDVFGYFDGQPSNGGYNTTTSGRALDTRTNDTPIPGNGFIDVTVGGVAGLPVYSPSITAFAMNVTAITSNPNVGHLTIWPSDLSEPAVNSVEYAQGNVTNLVLVRPGTDNKIRIRNNGSDPVHVVIDSEGWFTNTGTLPPAVGTDPSRSGNKGAWSLIKQSLNDRTQAAINPVTGNLLLTQQLLSMTGVGPGLSIGIRYNAINDQRPTLNTGLFEGQLFRNATNTEILYTAPDGGSYRFSPVGNGTYVVPRDLNAHLTRTIDGSPGASSGPGATYELVFHPDQTKNVYVSDGANLKLVRTEDVTGANKIFYNYAAGKLTSITDTQGRVINYAYTSANNPTQPSSITDTSLNRTISFTYNSATAAIAPGALATVTDATGAVTTYAYGSNGKVSSVTDGRGSRTDFTYISGAKLSTLVAGANNTAISATWTMAYPTSTKTTATDPRGKLYTIEFPNVVTGGITVTGQVSKITNPRGKITSSVLNSHGDVTSRKNATLDTTQYDIAANTYNLNMTTSPTGGTGGTGAAGRTSSSTFPTPVGNGATADYRATSTKDAQKNQTNLTYNSWGQTSTAQVGVPAGGGTPLGGTLTWKYQGEAGVSCGGKVGQLCQKIDAKGTITGYSYNSAGNLTGIDNPAPLGDQSFVYDAAGRVVAMTDGKGQTRNTCYDKNDRITQVSYTSSACATASGVTYAYDAAGNRTSTIDASGTTTYTFDALNRPTLLDRSGTAQDSAATYDRASNVLSYVDGGTGSGYTTSYGYDDANNVISLAEPGGSCPAGAVTPNSTKCTLFTVDDNNRRTKTDFPNGTDTNVAWDPSGRMSSVSTVNSSNTVLVKRDYAYTSATNADTALISKTTDEAGSSTTYGYDTMNRLTAAMTKNTGGTTTANSAWTFDVNSNRTQQNSSGVITNYGYNAADQLCWSGTGTSSSCTAPSGATTYTYDGNGNQTSGGNSYNAYDQLTGTTTGGTQAYNYAGSSNNTRYTAGGATFTNSLMGQLTARAGTNVDAKFVRDPSGALIAFQSAGSSFYYTRDNVDSVLLLTGPAQTAVASYTYDAYGNTLTSSGTQAGPNPYRFATGYLDSATGLLKMGARYYNPVIGRFTQTDPSGQEQNNYLYAGANPIVYNDPTGLFEIDFWAAAGAVGGAFLGAFACGPLCAVAGATLGANAVDALHEGDDYGFDDMEEDTITYGVIGLAIEGASELGQG